MTLFTMLGYKIIFSRFLQIFATSIGKYLIFSVFCITINLEENFGLLAVRITEKN